MVKLSSVWQKQSSPQGFILLELAISTFATIIFLTMVIRGLSQVLPTWNKIYCKTNLYNAGHYMLSIMEKNISYDASIITISKDTRKNDRLICQTTNGNHSFTFTCENKHIYKTITKATTSGKNPLYVSDCYINSWKLTKLDESLLKVELNLQQKDEEIKLIKIINCLNGRIEIDAT